MKRANPLVLVVGLTAALLQACGSSDDEGNGLSNLCTPPPNYAEGSTATYRFDRADGPDEDVTVTIDSVSEATASFVIEADAGAYTVTDDIGCYGSDNEPPRASSDIENDPVARTLLSGALNRFDEARPPPIPPPVSPPTDAPPRPCQTLDGSEEVELFASRETIRCVYPLRAGVDDPEATVTTESLDLPGSVGDEPVPVAGLIFKERVRASGEVDRVRLIDWNDR